MHFSSEWNPCFTDRAPVSQLCRDFFIFVHYFVRPLRITHIRRLICGCSLDRVEVESSLSLWVELVCMEAAVDQEDTSHNHSCKEVEDLRRMRQNWKWMLRLQEQQAVIRFIYIWIDIQNCQILPYIIIVLIKSFNYCLTCSLCLFNWIQDVY